MDARRRKQGTAHSGEHLGDRDLPGLQRRASRALRPSLRGGRLHQGLRRVPGLAQDDEMTGPSRGFLSNLAVTLGRRAITWLVVGIVASFGLAMVELGISVFLQLFLKN